MNDDITMAQVKAGEDAVVERLRQKGLLPTEEQGVFPDVLKVIDQRQQLEHSLATTFITLQREKNPAERTRLWGECLRLAAEIEKMQ